mmetsp:Transcript_7897/g.12229  ORF Transcript_7897/g.12229 Transcript_7897/m.12229 type:complete len:217 (-) Transcript_7897:938-1588(-)
MAALTDLEVHDSTTDLEKVLGDVFLVRLELFQVRLDQDVLLRLLQELVQVAAGVSGQVIVQEMQFGEHVHEVDLASHVLFQDEHVLEFLMQVSDHRSVILFFLFFLHLGREESVSVLLLRSNGTARFEAGSRSRSALHLAVVEQELSLLEQGLVFSLVALQLLHGVITDLLELLFILHIDLLLNGFPLVRPGFGLAFLDVRDASPVVFVLLELLGF